MAASKLPELVERASQLEVSAGFEEDTEVLVICFIIMR